MKSMSISDEAFAFARKWSDTYVETGTYLGGSLRAAITAGFERLYTCDANREFMHRAYKALGNIRATVHFYHGDSPERLPVMLDEAASRCSILLDAHPLVREEDSRWPSDPFPLLKELEALSKQRRHDHLIMVDDIDQCGTPKMGNIWIRDVEAGLLAINPGYTFLIMDGVRPQMLLVAVPPGYDKVAV